VQSRPLQMQASNPLTATPSPRTNTTTGCLGIGAVKNLLQMESGFSYSETTELSGTTLQIVFSQPDTAAFAASFPQAFRPGTFFGYSTANTALVQYMMR
jgi:CubicO group peptidase (beta-lactamase class C family)